MLLGNDPDILLCPEDKYFKNGNNVVFSGNNPVCPKASVCYSYKRKRKQFFAFPRDK
jgi:hypothetical protein